jgi:uncharacterized protein YyaL (SSP411 family)
VVSIQPLAASEVRKPNRLVDSTNPYLLQHAWNPVDWYPWGEEALARARREDRPILLSIGYSACHWCHVMAHESFEDDRIAALLNEHFVSIKVDREERPDIDEVYMTATLAMNQGRGGWPMTVFLTPDREPFFAGTYFPPEDRWGRPGFATLLRQIADLWNTDRQALVRQAEQVTEVLRSRTGRSGGASVGEAELRRALGQLEEDYDPSHGGFGGAPKFPPATAIRLLLRLWRRLASGHALDMARTTLEAMARGGLHDQIGGGFHRYATDERWLVPHFEKMLYDNALLAKAYSEGYQATGEELFRRVASSTLDYVLREMTAGEGGFYSSSDADSEGQEGRYFVWTPGEVRAVLGEEEARRFCAWYDITPQGNWEGKSIPNRFDPEKVVAWRMGEPIAALERRVEAARPQVLEARRRRVAPALDDKILTAWNGLMIGGLAEGGRALGEGRYVDAAARAADFVLTRLRSADGRLQRTWRQGRASIDGFLEDHAFLAEGLIDLYEAGGRQHYLESALTLAETLLNEFRAEDGSFLPRTRHHEELILVPHEGQDGATPSANATAAHVLARLACHFERPDLREAAVRAIAAYGVAITEQPRAFAKSLIAAELLLEPPVELAVVGTPGKQDYEALQREVGRHFVPGRVLAHSDPESAGRPLALLAGRPAVGDRATLYVCRGAACLAPIVSVSDVAAALQQ